MDYHREIQAKVRIARNTRPTEKNFTNCIYRITEIINQNGTAAFDCFKSIFHDFKQSSFREALKDEYQIDERILASVLQNITVEPQVCSSSEVPKTLYRACNATPMELIDSHGYCRPTGEKSLLKHQQSTVRSIFISTSSDLKVACEFASTNLCNGKLGFVYQINPKGAASCHQYLHPYRFYQSENEYVFTRHLPLENILGVSWVKSSTELATRFYKLEQHKQLIVELINLGLVTL